MGVPWGENEYISNYRTEKFTKTLFRLPRYYVFIRELLLFFLLSSVKYSSSRMPFSTSAELIVEFNPKKAGIFWLSKDRGGRNHPTPVLVLLYG